MGGGEGGIQTFQRYNGKQSFFRSFPTVFPSYGLIGFFRFTESEPFVRRLSHARIEPTS